MGISILSYCGSATLAVISDARLVPDPEAITQEFNREFAAMLRAVRPKTPAVRKTAGRRAPATARRSVRTTPVAKHAKHAPPHRRAADQP